MISGDAKSEIWLPVEGFEGRYEVSDQGRVRSLRSRNGRKPGYIRKPQKGSGHGRKGSESPGRPHFTLWDGQRQKTLRLAVLVASAFLGPCPPGHEVCHNDGDDWNCAVSNLRYDTHSANIMDSVRQGTHRSARKKTCRFGHPLDGLRTNSKTGRQTRYCKTCNRERVTLGIHAADRMVVT